MIRSRIAPTPSGYLHIGNAYNFVLTWLWVRKEGGTLRLRIDDIDAPRAKPEYVEDIFQSLHWMGTDWDEGPKDPDEQARLYSQTLRAERYNEVIEQLINSGKVFACECSRTFLANNTCSCKNKNIPVDQKDTALRIMTTEEPIMVNDIRGGVLKINLNETMKDFVVRRRDGIAAYQLASLLDDIDRNTNLIVRGADLLPSTAVQLYLASLIGDDLFKQSIFYHHRLLKDDQGHKLSKSEDSNSLRDMRARGESSELLFRALSKSFGWRGQCSSLLDMLDFFKGGNEIFG